jgi:pimeloyl-ACP methyl ester carboxylesterase
MVGGVRTAWLDAGSGEPVVCVHGVPTSSELFEPLLPALAGFRVIAPDLVGHGETEAPPGSLGWTRYAGHLEAFLDAVAPPRFDLVVHDLGGALGLDWAGRHPERVRRLVVLSTTVHAGLRWTALWSAIWALELAGGAPAVRRMIGALARRHGSVPRDLAERWARPWDRRRVLRSFDLLSPWRLRESAAGLANLRAPALLLWGDRDEVFPPAHGERLRAALPDATLELVPGAGHWTPRDAPELVGARVAAFLSARPTRR